MFRGLPGPRPQALEGLIQSINQRVGTRLEREGLLVRDIENTYLQLEHADEAATARLAALVPKPRLNLARFARIFPILARFAGR